jgi:DNA-directed RNA polymerase subunit RPC12/RpoP
MYFYFQANKYLFDCLECGHEFTRQISKISGRSDWCPYCSHKQLCENNSCNMCFKNSFASHEKSIFWSKINVKQPREIFKSSASKWLFDCCECGHIFENSLHVVSKVIGVVIVRFLQRFYVVKTIVKCA